MSLEWWRSQIEDQANIALWSSTAMQRALKWGLIQLTPKKIEFYFETTPLRLAAPPAETVRIADNGDRTGQAGRDFLKGAVFERGDREGAEVKIKYELTKNGLCLTVCPYGEVWPGGIKRVSGVGCAGCEFNKGNNRETQEVECSKEEKR